MGGMWRTAEFGLAAAAAYAALSLGGDPVLMVFALASGLFFAELGVWTAQTLSQTAKTVWGIVAVIFFVGEGLGIYVHTHPVIPPPPDAKVDLPTVSPPAKQKPGTLPPILAQTPPATESPPENERPKALPSAKWVVTDLAFDPPFDEAKLKDTYKVKITVRNDGDGESSPPNTRQALIIPPALLGRKELDHQFENAAKIALDTEFLNYTSPSLEKGQTLSDDLFGDIPQNSVRAVHGGTLQLYVPVIISWVDTGTPKGTYRTSEFCGIVGASIGSFHICNFHNTEPRLKRLPAADPQPQGQPVKPAEK